MVVDGRKAMEEMEAKLTVFDARVANERQYLLKQIAQCRLLEHAEGGQATTVSSSGDPWPPSAQAADAAAGAGQAAERAGQAAAPAVGQAAEPAVDACCGPGGGGATACDAAPEAPL